MICSKCGTNNLIRADYCSSCGHAFTGQEKADAYRETVYGKLDRLEEAQSWLTLKKITENLFFRIAVLAFIALAGILSHTNQGTEMKLLESEEYVIDWNRERNEYYLYSDLDEIRLRLYLPGMPEALSVTALDDEGNEMHTETYSVDEEPVLLKDTPFYRITGIYEDGETELCAGVYDTALRNGSD